MAPHFNASGETAEGRGGWRRRGRGWSKKLFVTFHFLSHPLALRSGHDQSFPQQFDAFRVENRRVIIRTMRLTPIIILLLAVSLGVLLWAVAPAVMGRPLMLWEALLLIAAIMVLLAWWRRRRLWREREQLESLRDSALW